MANRDGVILIVFTKERLALRLWGGVAVCQRGRNVLDAGKAARMTPRSQFAGNEDVDVQRELPRRKLDVGGRSSGGRSARE